MIPRLFAILGMALVALIPRLTAAVTIMPTGAAAGEWSYDWPAVRDLAKANNTFYIINFGKTSGCSYCTAAESGVFSKDEFKNWARDNGIPLLYANRVSTTMEPGVSVKATYPGLLYYPTMIIVDGTSATGKTKIADFIYRINREYNGIKIKLTPADFIAIVDSYTKKPSTDDAWDSATKLPGDEAWTNATALAMGATNRLHGAHTLKNSDTSDWFAFTNLAAGARYRVATTNVTVQNAVAQLSLYANEADAASGTAWTNLPLSVATTGLFFTATSSGAGYAKASRGVTNSANVTYTLAYRNADATPHALTVVNGTGSEANALEGQGFAVAADADPADQFFAGWAVNPAGAALGAGFNAAQRNGVVIMPAADVTLTAQYQAVTRVISLTGSLAFGGVMTNRTAQKTLTVANTGNGVLTVNGIATPAGFTATPTSFTVNPGASRSVTVTFAPTALQDYTGTLTVDSDNTSGTETSACSGTGIDNTPPQVTARSPAGNPAMIIEGASVSFSVTANDTALDPDAASRGMVSVSWLVDGAEQQVTTSGAPGAIASAFTFRSNTNTVSGVISNSFTVTAVALDRQGGRTETAWTLWIRNAAAAQSITFPAIPVMGLGDADFAPGATASSGLPVEYTSSNEEVAQIVGGLVRLVGAGSTTITASQPGDADFNAAADVKRTLTVRVRVLAVASPAEGGTVSGGGVFNAGARVTLRARPASGYTFLRWEDGQQSATRRFVVGSAPVDATAFFKATADIEPPVLGNPGPQNAMVGVLFGLTLDLTSDSAPTVRVSGLPSGLRYDSSTQAITGTPTVIVADKAVTISAKNVNPTTVTETFGITVEELPQWAWGTFNGWCLHESLGQGSLSLSVTSKGNVSGKVAVAGTNYSFRATSYLRRDEDGTLWLTAEAVAGKARLPLTFKAYQASAAVLLPKGAGGVDVPDTLSVVEGWFGAADDDPADAVLYRNVWKDEGMSLVIENYAGYYTATLPVNADAQAQTLAVPETPLFSDEAPENTPGSAYLTFTVAKAGTVKAVGKLADGTSVSMSGALILDDVGRLWTVVYAGPSAYKGGVFFGLVEFVQPVDGPVFVRLLDGIPFTWRSLNAQATGAYGDGFDRTLKLAGGWYDKLGNLYDYYADKALSVGVEVSDKVPALTVGTNRFESVWWSPDGLALTVITNRLGVMTGLSAPAAAAPTTTGGDWVYDGDENTVGLTLRLTRATGLFSGSFKAWFDYGSTHTYRRIACVGALTPVREYADDGVEGRGYFLSSDKSTYLNPANRAVSYSFNDSYDFVIESDTQN